jgi:hypothetical protein
MGRIRQTGPARSRIGGLTNRTSCFSPALLGRRVAVINTQYGTRTTIKGQPIDPASIRRYLAQKFGHELAYVRAGMEALAKAYSPDQLATQAYALYEQFRPDIPEGKKGWGAAGQLELDQIRSLGEEK